MVDPKKLIETWRDDLTEDNYVGRPLVQDRLLALWGEVGDEGTRVVERWLAVTPHRSLFSATELREMLDEVESVLDGSPLPA